VLELDRAELDFEFLGDECLIDDLFACAAFDSGVAFRESFQNVCALRWRIHCKRFVDGGVAITGIMLLPGEFQSRVLLYTKAPLT